MAASSSSSSSATMNTHEILPTLALSDIMHHFSPSPVDPTSNAIGHTNTPQPVTSADVIAMRVRLRELQNAAMIGPDATGLREAELFQMVSRLTETLPIDPAQLDVQAETIGQLIQQRDLLFTQAAQERERWQAERDSWERSAEALISQRARVSKVDEIERQRGVWEAENRSLRDKVKEAENKLAAMESEVSRLRPLLLMQPYSISRLKQNLGVSSRDKGKKRDAERSRTIPNDEDPANSKTSTQSDTLPTTFSHQPPNNSPLPMPPAITITSPNSSFPSAPKPQSQSQQSYPPPRRPHHSKSSGSKSSKHAKSSTLTSDALTAHLLLAAQRIGRQRATLVTGLMRKAEQEREEQAKVQEQLRHQVEQAEKEKLERLANNVSRVGYYRAGADSLFNSPQRGTTTSQTPSAMPRTPKRNSYVPQSGGSVGSPSQFVFINASVSTTPSGNTGPPEISRTPGAPALQKTVPSTNPPTPLDSLLDAARSMMDSPGRRKALDHPESPAPKRRRASGTAVSKPNGRLTRVRSALEVLAEEAAAASGSGSNGANYDPSQEGQGNRPGLLDTPLVLSPNGKGEASEVKIRGQSPSSATTESTSNSSTSLRQSSRRRGTLQNAGSEDSSPQATQPPTRTSKRLSIKESLSVRKGRARKITSQPNGQDDQNDSLLRGVSASSVARLIAPADEYLTTSSGRSNTLQKRSTQTSSASEPPLIKAPSMNDGDSTTSVDCDDDVNPQNHRDVREGGDRIQCAQNSRAYTTAETITNQSFLQGGELQHLVNNASQPRPDATAAVEGRDGSHSRVTPNNEILAPETSNQPQRVNNSRARGVGRDEDNILDINADREGFDGGIDNGSDMEVADDNEEKEEGKLEVVTVLSASRTPRSCSPQPLAVRSPISRNGLGQLNVEEDHDADAEGEMDLGDAEGQQATFVASS